MRKSGEVILHPGGGGACEPCASAGSGPVTQDLGGGGVGGGARGVAAVRSSAGDSDTHARRAGDTGLCSSH